MCQGIRNVLLTCRNTIEYCGLRGLNFIDHVSRLHNTHLTL